MIHLFLVFFLLHYVSCYIFKGTKVVHVRRRNELFISPLYWSRCGQDKDIYWAMKDSFHKLRDKAKRIPYELDFECFIKWPWVSKLSKEEIEELWVQCAQDVKKPATFKQFLKMCDELDIDTTFKVHGRVPFDEFAEGEHQNLPYY